jgi:DNA replication and repair protein RecF
LQTIGFRFTLQIKYLPSLISTARVAEYLDRELMVGHSLIGPHKDDFAVVFPGSLLDESNTDWLEIAKYGSRGQQRLAVLWLKLGELEYVRHKLGAQPMLLLDDILSELDHESRSIVFELLETYQTVITTADDETLSEIREKLPNSELIQLE